MPGTLGRVQAARVPHLRRCHAGWPLMPECAASSDRLPGDCRAKLERRQPGGGVSSSVRVSLELAFEFVRYKICQMTESKAK